MKTILLILFISSSALGNDNKPPMRKDYPTTLDGSKQYQADLKAFNNAYVSKQKQLFKEFNKYHKGSNKASEPNNSNVKGVKGCKRDSNGNPVKRK